MRTYDFELTGVAGSLFMSPGETFNEKITSKTLQEKGDTEVEMIIKMEEHALSRGCYISCIDVYDDDKSKLSEPNQQKNITLTVVFLSLDLPLFVELSRAFQLHP